MVSLRQLSYLLLDAVLWYLVIRLLLYTPVQLIWTGILCSVNGDNSVHIFKYSLVCGQEGLCITDFV